MSIAFSSAVPLWHAALLVAPTVFGVVAAAVASRGESAAWRVARVASIVMLAAAATCVLIRAVTNDRAGALSRSDTLGVAMLLLVTFVGWVVVRYSSAYLAGDPHEQRYVVRLLVTLASVCLVVVSNNLVVLVVSWTATSLALHGLLTFFGDRPAAVAAAHKKFILGRCADVAMIGAVVCFGSTFETMRIDEIVARAASAAELPVGARVGIALVALAALLKTAQLPFHGWLIQVMEAPTPVSALLHAGIVNLGGFVLLRFAPVVDRAVETRALLVVIGVATAAVAALVMTTRISVKVALAWSTCAQMGFMLMQCGLGIWEMAFLHLIAHSLYKAHAFLGAGGTVRDTQRRELAVRRRAPSGTQLAVGAAMAIVATMLAGWVWGRLPFVDPASPTLWVLGGIVALALVPLATPARATGGGRLFVLQLVGVASVPFVYFGLHELSGRLVPHAPDVPVALLVVVAVGFLALFAVQTVRVVAPKGPALDRLYPWIYGGLFLDELFTRAAFAIWPPPAPRLRDSPLPRCSTEPVIGPWPLRAAAVSGHTTSRDPNQTIGTHS